MSLEKDINDLKALVEDSNLFKPSSGDDLAIRKEADRLSGKITHDFECQECGAPATINVQGLLHCWKILPDGEMEEVGDSYPMDDNNDYWCDACAIKHGWSRNI